MRGVPNARAEIHELHGVALMASHLVCEDAYSDGEHFIAACGVWIERWGPKQANPWWMATCTACLDAIHPFQANLRVEKLANCVVGAVLLVWFQPETWDP